MIKEISFGTDGWRGIIDTDVTNKTIARLAQAFSYYLVSNSEEKDVLKVAVAYDGRLHSRPWALLFARVLSGNNIVAYLSDRILPTPMLSYYVRKKNLNAGVILTASHNTAEYNGVKFKCSYGGPYSTEESLGIQALIGNELVQADDEKIYQVDLCSDYLTHVEELIDFKLITKSNLNILIDSMAGAGQQILESLFMKHGIESKTIYKLAEKDFCGRKPEPVEKNLNPLSEELLRGDYSLGVATDGDADRLGIMLDNGSWLSTQECILLLADYVINKKNIPGNIVKTSSVTDKLKLLFEGSERKVIDVQVGFKNISQKMVSEHIAFACEESGGFAFSGHIPDKDGLFSALLFIEMLAASGFNKLSDYVREKRKQFGNICFKRADFAYEVDRASEAIKLLSGSPPLAIGDNKVISFKEFHNNNGNLNGIKYSFEGIARWLLIRTSETEPLVRVYAEGTTEEEADNIISMGWNLLQSKDQDYLTAT